VITTPPGVFCDYEISTGERLQAKIGAPEELFYGYGLVSSKMNGHACLGHDGAMVGYVSSILADMDDGLGVVVLVNAPEIPSEIARFALQLVRATLQEQDLPPLPPPADPTWVENAADYTGHYRKDGGHFQLTVEEGSLVLQDGNDRIHLEPRGTDIFYVGHNDWDRFLLSFRRAGGQVIEAFHGPDWYVHSRYRGPTSFNYPAEWEAYPGHYRAHNPWLSNFRVVMRKGTLELISPNGAESALVPVDDRTFRVGMDEHSPERICFGPIVEGRALGAILSGGEYYRTFTP
jgi:hypothetical protein